MLERMEAILAGFGLMIEPVKVGLVVLLLLVLLLDGFE